MIHSAVTERMEMVQETWPIADAASKTRIAPLGAAAACQLGLAGRAEVFQSYVEAMPKDSVEGAIYQGMLLVHTEQVPQTVIPNPQTLIAPNYPETLNFKPQTPKPKT